MEFKKRKSRYQENLLLLGNLLDEIAAQMKGRTISYQKEIVDGNGNFSQEKLEALLDRMLSVWEREIQDGTDIDASDYLAARRELYRCYLYLVMRCSLLKSGGWNEKTTYEFVLSQAKKLGCDWCILEENGQRSNLLASGNSGNFGLHVYDILEGERVMPDDGVFSCLQTGSRSGITDDGACKRVHMMNAPMQLNRMTGKWEVDEELLERARTPEAEVKNSENEAAEGGSRTEDDGQTEDGDWTEDDDYNYDDDYDPDEDYDYEPLFMENAYAWEPPSEEQIEKEQREEAFRLSFQNREAYMDAYFRFKELFREASPAVLKDFYQELEQIVDWYLLSEDLTALTDGKRTLAVNKKLKEYALAEARRYAKGIEWKR